jgi:hypothetical protein
MASFDQSSQMYEHDSDSNIDMENVDAPSKKSQKGTKKSQKGGKQKVVSRRGGSFTKEEDIVICSAFLNVSKDPITGMFSDYSVSTGTSCIFCIEINNMQVSIKLRVGITNACMNTSTSTNQKIPTVARSQFNIGGEPYRRQ